MIIRGGENIYPKEIEDFIYTHPKVKDVQVIGVPDEQYGEEIMACVILREGETLTEDELKDYIRSHMAKHKTPRYISFVDAFPMKAGRDLHGGGDQGVCGLPHGQAQDSPVCGLCGGLPHERRGQDPQVQNARERRRAARPAKSQQNRHRVNGPRSDK